MNGPRINNDDRGITINKQLAWAMILGLVGAGIWLGTETASTKSMIQSLADQQTQRHAETLSQRRETDSRLRALESSRATADSELGALRRDFNEWRSETRRSDQAIQDAIKELTRRLTGGTIQ